MKEAQLKSYLSVGKRKFISGNRHGWCVVEVKAQLLLHADQLDAAEDVGDLLLQVVIGDLPWPCVGWLVLEQGGVEELGKQDVDGGEAHLVFRVHVRLVAGELEQQLDHVLLGVEAGRVKRGGEQLLVDMARAGSSLRIGL